MFKYEVSFECESELEWDPNYFTGKGILALGEWSGEASSAALVVPENATIKVISPKFQLGDKVVFNVDGETGVVLAGPHEAQEGGVSKTYWTVKYSSRHDFHEYVDSDEEKYLEKTDG